MRYSHQVQAPPGNTIGFVNQCWTCIKPKSVAFDFVPGGFDFVVGGFLVVAYIPCGGDFVEHISSAGLRSQMATVMWP